MTFFECDDELCPTYFFDTTDHNEARAQFNRRAREPVGFLHVEGDGHSRFTLCPPLPVPGKYALFPTPALHDRRTSPPDDHAI